ncbi:uncharacterized protein BXZ73DRAFT_107916 [Epithele typhae]|uniref:uncharacterized protein n=1 Tax=Epithele typhae TaxID=378194 RepID=UPI0020072A4C|nr:uncharacterized protein BXZ73DRAFT_107916 [Epithele typhae]KAH9911532.1 hypothetical protein BXZ73DRAFT_107916 [Epithele typhae]
MPLYAVVSSRQATEKGTPFVRIRQSSSIDHDSYAYYSACKVTQVIKRRVFFPSVAHSLRDPLRYVKALSSGIQSATRNYLARTPPTMPVIPTPYSGLQLDEDTRPSPYTPDSMCARRSRSLVERALSSSSRRNVSQFVHDFRARLLRASITLPAALVDPDVKLPDAAVLPRGLRTVLKGGYHKRQAAVFHEARVDAT